MMKFIASSAITSALLVLGLAAPAHAQTANRAWVSGHGTDAAGCGATTAPCRTLQYVHDNIIAAGGEIDILDPAGYGSITIGKALSIVNDGVGTAGIVPPINGIAITINAGAADTVYLRGLNVEGLGNGYAGVQFNSGGNLKVVNCVLRHFTDFGIEVTISGGSTRVVVVNTITSDEGYAGMGFYNSGSGKLIGVVSQSTVADNTTSGISTQNTSTGSVYITIDGSIVSNSGYGVSLGDAGTSMLLSRSVITGNQLGIFLGAGSTGSTSGDNKISGNTTNVGGTLATIANM